MKKTIIGAAAIAATVATTPVRAADIGRVAPAPYASTAPIGGYVWTGPYVGLNLGYQWGKVSGWGGNPSGLAGGVQAGYNWQSGQFVFGGETDLQLSGADDIFAGYKFSNTWFGTTRARGGVALSNVLLYLTAGIAYGGLKVESAGLLSESHTHLGWTVGGGIEVGFTPNWSAKAEYLYIDLSDKGHALPPASVGVESNIIRMGVNYRF